MSVIQKDGVISGSLARMPYVSMYHQMINKPEKINI